MQRIDNINVDGESWGARGANFETRTVGLIKQIQSSKVGSVLLQCLRETKYDVLIEPTDGGSEATRHKYVEVGGQLTPFMHRHGEVFISFNPGAPNRSGKQISLGVAGLSLRSDQLKPIDELFHELFHALHMLRSLPGLPQIERMGQGFDNEAEFFAIMLTNMFRSERGSARLRADHSDKFHELNQTDREVWMKHFWRFGKLKHQLPNLVRKLKGLNLPFNPLKPADWESGYAA